MPPTYRRACDGAARGRAATAGEEELTERRRRGRRSRSRESAALPAAAPSSSSSAAGPGGSRPRRGISRRGPRRWRRAGRLDGRSGRRVRRRRGRRRCSGSRGRAALAGRSRIPGLDGRPAPAPEPRPYATPTASSTPRYSKRGLVVDEVLDRRRGTARRAPRAISRYGHRAARASSTPGAFATSQATRQIVSRPSTTPPNPCQARTRFDVDAEASATAARDRPRVLPGQEGEIKQQHRYERLRRSPASRERRNLSGIAGPFVGVRSVVRGL